MQLVDLEQGCSEWLELRREKITSTDCAPIQGRSRYKSPRMVWLEKMGRYETPMNAAMQKGKDLEPVARKLLEYNYNMACPAAVYLSDSNPWQMASLDGYCREKKIIVEIKVVGEKTYNQVKNDYIPEEYVCQSHHHMACVEEAEEVLLAFFHFTDPFAKPDCHMEVISRNDREIEMLTEAERRFYQENVLRFKEPEFTELDTKQRSDAEWVRAAKNWTISKLDLDKAKADEEFSRQQLIELAKGDSACKLVGGGISVSSYPRRGAVDYSLIPELKGVDTDKYRKEGSEVWRISIA